MPKRKHVLAAKRPKQTLT